MVCAISCIVAIVFITANIYCCTMGDKSRILQEFISKLSPENRSRYADITKERQAIYFKGLLLGFIISIILLTCCRKYFIGSRGGMLCMIAAVTFSVNYKITPNFRKSPAVIYLGLSKSSDRSTAIEGEMFAYNEIYYNVDMNDFSWDDQNVDFFDKVNLEFCPIDGESETRYLDGLTTPGKYYVFAYAKINASAEPRSQLDTSWLATSITITENSTITCKKGKATKKITSSNPKCPSGFKKVG